MKIETLRKILTPCFHTFRRVKFINYENLPKDEAVIFISNHQGLIDPFLVGFKYPHMIHWMAKKQLFKHKFIAHFITSLGAYPVDRDGSQVGATKTTIGLLKEGKQVGIFPQGTRAKKDKPVPKAKPGFVRYAAETDTIVQPVHIYGKNHIFGKLFVVFGEPFKVPADLEKSKYTEYAQQKLDEIYAIDGGSVGNTKS